MRYIIFFIILLPIEANSQSTKNDVLIRQYDKKPLPSCDKVYYSKVDPKIEHAFGDSIFLRLKGLSSIVPKDSQCESVVSVSGMWVNCKDSVSISLSANVFKDEECTIWLEDLIWDRLKTFKTLQVPYDMQFRNTLIRVVLKNGVISIKRS